MFERFQDVFSTFHVVVGICLRGFDVKPLFGLQDPDDTGQRRSIGLDLVMHPIKTQSERTWSVLSLIRIAAR
jgi:hypothetical protein